jgi:hypothetical protein
VNRLSLPSRQTPCKSRIARHACRGQVRRLGFMKGRILVPDDFDRMGKTEIERLFGGDA